MGGILETAMLICFGCSWPINLVKNYKCRSAKGMSLPFILLLIVGYVAGICAKFIIGVNDTTGRKICPSYKYKRIYQKHKIKQGKFVAFPY